MLFTQIGCVSFPKTWPAAPVRLVEVWQKAYRQKANFGGEARETAAKMIDPLSVVKPITVDVLGFQSPLVVEEIRLHVLIFVPAPTEQCRTNEGVAASHNEHLAIFWNAFECFPTLKILTPLDLPACIQVQKPSSSCCFFRSYRRVTVE
jgi:hypothetical protein